VFCDKNKRTMLMFVKWKYVSKSSTKRREKNESRWFDHTCTSNFCGYLQLCSI